MTDDDRIPPLLRRAAGGEPPSPDLAAVRHRGRRRHAARVALSSVAAVVVLVGAGVAVAAQPSRQAVQLSSDGAAPTPARPAGVATLPPAAEGEVVATGEGFVLVSGAVPAQVWSSPDADRWTRRPGRGLGDDLLVDVGTATDGAVVALTTTGELRTSHDRGATWRRVQLPDDVGRVTQVAGDDTRWYLAGTTGSGVRLVAVPRDAPNRVDVVEGDLDVAGLRRDRPAALVASGTAGTVLVADGAPDPTVWLVADDLTATRVDGAFGDVAVSGVVATGDGFAATVVPDGADRPELWRSADGRTWTPEAGDLPVPSCAVVAESGGAAVAGGSPCDQDAGWQLWRRAGDTWVPIGREVEGR